MTSTTVSASPGPKAWIGTILAAVLTYLVTQDTLDLPAWADVAINATVIGVGVYLGRPQPTTP